MTGHLAIIQTLMTEQGKTHVDAAKAFGWESPSTVGNKLRGERRTQIWELKLMAEFVGITLARLAELSDDLVLTEHPESVKGATLIDSLPPEKRALALQMLEAMTGKPASSQS